MRNCSIGMHPQLWNSLVRWLLMVQARHWCHLLQASSSSSTGVPWPGTIPSASWFLIWHQHPYESMASTFEKSWPFRGFKIIIRRTVRAQWTDDFFWKGDVSLLNIIVLIAEHFVDERLCVTGLTISSNNGNKTGDFHLLQIFILNLMIGMKNVRLITDCRALERHSGNDSNMSDN